MRVAAYCRVSTDKDDQLNSFENQKEFFTTYAKNNGHTLYQIYADEGISGTRLKKRDDFRRLLNDAKYDLFDMVVVKDISRFARNTVDFLQSIRTLKALGINTVFLTANMTSLGDSEFILTIFGALAQEESANLSKRVKWGKKINSEKGRVPPRIFGYDRIDNFTLKINEEEAAIVKEIYRLYLNEGLGCRTLSLRLNEMGATTKFGHDWNPRAVRRVLSNPIYCGHYINHKYEVEDFLTGKMVPLPETDHYHHNRPEWAIVSPETFNAASERLSKRREQYTHGDCTRDGRYSTRHVFSTLIRCEHCGRSFTRRSYTYVNTRHYWRCQTSNQFTAEACENTVCLTEGDILDFIREYFKTIIEDKDKFIADIIEEFQKTNPSKEAKPFTKSDVEKRIKQLEKRKSKFQDMYAEDLLTIQELKNKLEPIKNELNQLEVLLREGIAKEEMERDAAAVAKKYLEDIEAFLTLENVNNLDMRKIIDHISVNSSGNVKVYLKRFEDISEQ